MFTREQTLRKPLWDRSGWNTMTPTPLCGLTRSSNSAWSCWSWMETEAWWMPCLHVDYVHWQDWVSSSECASCKCQIWACQCQAWLEHFMVTCAPRPGLDKEISKVLVLCRTQNYCVTALQDQKLLTCTRKAKQLKVLCKLLWLCSFAMQTPVKMMSVWINNMLSALSARRMLQVSMRDLCMHVFLPAPETSFQRQLW